MLSKRTTSAATVLSTLILLLTASPAFSRPVQSAAAIGVRPKEQPAPVQESTPYPQDTVDQPMRAIGVYPVQPEPVPVQQPIPIQQGYPVQETNPVYQPVPVQQPFPVQQPVPIQQGYPVQQVIPEHTTGVITVDPNNGQQARAVVDNLGHAKAVVALQNLLNNQAALGQFPHNNAVLADVNKLVSKHSQAASPKVRVINSGPGTLRVTLGNGSTIDVRPNFSLDLDIGTTQTQLEAQFQNVLISLEHAANGVAKFWDQDDRRHTRLAPNQYGAAQKHHFTLTPGVWGHHLTR